jgi:hypothetical protein
MLITKDKLKQIIKEELEVSVTGRHGEMHGGAYQKDPDGYEGRMAKGNLYKIAEYAHELHDIIMDDENLEPWVQEKIAVAAQMMDSVGHYLQYEKHRAHEDEEGHEDHADLDPSERDEEEMSSGEEDEDYLEFDEETEFEEGGE